MGGVGPEGMAPRWHQDGPKTWLERLVDLASGQGFAKRFNGVYHAGRRANDGSWTAWLCTVPGVAVAVDAFGRYQPDSMVTLTGPGL